MSKRLFSNSLKNTSRDVPELKTILRFKMRDFTALCRVGQLARRLPSRVFFATGKDRRPRREASCNRFTTFFELFTEMVTGRLPSQTLILLLAEASEAKLKHAPRVNATNKKFGR